MITLQMPCIQLVRLLSVSNSLPGAHRRLSVISGKWYGANPVETLPNVVLQNLAFDALVGVFQHLRSNSIFVTTFQVR